MMSALFHGQILFDRKMSVRIDNKSVEDRPMSNLPSKSVLYFSAVISQIVLFIFVLWNLLFIDL